MRFSYAIARLFQIIPTFILIGLVVFLLARAMPGDTISLMNDRATDAQIEQLQRQVGLDRPWWEQFITFFTGLLHGNLGTSIKYRIPVGELIWGRLPVTLLLAALSTVMALIVSIPLAFISAIYANRWPDVSLRVGFQVGLSSPVFYIGLILLTVFAAWLNWFPVGGYGTDLLTNLHHLFLPAATLALSFSAVILRNLRASILQVINSEFVTYATAKGIAQHLIMRRHILRNATVATVTLVGLQIGQLLGGAVITETVFAVPGVGRLMVDAILFRDYPVIQILTLVLAVMVSIAFLISDLVQMWLDPRISR